MSSGSNTNNSHNGNGADTINWQCVTSPDLVKQVDDSLEVQIAKFDEQSSEQEAQRKAKEERKKTKEEAKRVAKEEMRRLAEEEAKKKAEKDAQKRAEFQAWWQANLERKVGQGEKPKPKQHWAANQRTPGEEVKEFYGQCHDDMTTTTRGVGTRGTKKGRCQQQQ
ncbi:hypothetical protein SCLCIDRAFT_22956 [Scleroderma citrinum Foug A]|uniref:Uncharacterized protein n=1 Tax=Scleroderma citrinum Foug A TaxID=1036808 RepID=A0A0C3DX86_9AGAM|nr:hypothetical protein SCLCIDRAFT_22956 [Scleroderma citrinum Foug A]